MPAERRLFSLQPEDSALLDALADLHHGGNASALISGLVRRAAPRRELIQQALLDYWRATEPSDQVDPEDDARTEQPHLLLAALFDEQDARAIGEALNMIRLEQIEQLDTCALARGT
jgi:hypothetical protein